MSQRESTTATVPFVPPVRAAPPAYPTSEIALEAPPAPAGSARAGLLVRLLPVLMALATVGVMVAVTRSGAGAGRHPTFLVFPAMMLISAVVAAVTGRDGRAGELNGSRVQYLAYLSALRDNVTRTAAAQRSALLWCHPEPDSLWTLVGSSRMWERRPEDPDFNQVRVGVGTQRLATPLVAPEIGPADAVDPVTVTALRVFARAHATIADAPTVIGLGPSAAVTTDGDPAAARGLLRAMVCQLAVLQAPDRLLIAAATGGRNRSHWDWLKWLPHNQHPNAADAVGSSRMVYPTLREAETALAGLFDRAPQSTLAGLPQIVLIVDGAAIDGAERIDGPITGVTILEVGIRHRCLSAVAGVQLQMTTSGLLFRDAADAEVLARPDWISVAAAQVCARQLAAYRLGGSLPGAAARWQDMLGVNDLDAFDPAALWRGSHYRDRLCVPVGTTPDGASVELDIKEAAENGIGPHGLCVGATGSGKSEFLRTVALGMMARHSPKTLNLVLVDFKGGATFRGLEPAPHVAAVITNLADDAVLVDRMRDALAGEMNRRQEMLRVAGNLVSVAAYEQARRAGAQLAALPALFIIVDEFSELLMQQPDFVDMFCAIGRLGRSLGMYLLLASQRLDEGRLRGLESHLSYRVCLKTLTAGESRVVLGTPDAYHLPNTPGAALLRTGAGDLTRFQTVFVSALLAPVSPQPVLTVTESAPSVRVFSATPAGRVTAIRAGRADQVGGPTVLQTVVQRLCRSGPPARVVWLPPLGAPPALDAVLREGSSVSGGLSVPIGIVDRPFEQRRTRLTVELAGAAGNVAVVGSPQSGKTTALRTLLTGLAVTHDPCQVQFYCLDFGGGALASVRCLPHTGSVAGRAEPELAAGTIARLESIVRRRERFFRDHAIESMAQYRQFRSVRGADGDGFGDVFLVIDGWAAMRQQFEMLEAPITGLAVHGLSHGVHVVLSASRWAEIRPALKDAIGTRIELRLGDAADSELDRKHAQRVPKNSPGRGLSADGLQMAIALPRLDGISSSAGLAEATVRLGRALHDRYSGSVAPPVPLLPACVGHDRVLAQVSAGLRDGVLLGLEGHELRPVTVDFGRDPHLLILGDIECGKTTTLRTLCREIVRTRTADQARLVIADFRRGLIGVATSAYLGGYAISAPALAALMPKIIELLRRRMAPAQAGPEQLRTRSWWSGPDLYVVVDDYHLVAAASGNPLTPLLEYLPYATDLGLHLIIARRSAGAARAMFEPLLSGLRDAGATGLIMSGSPDEGPLIGSVRPAPLPPGRGILATRNRDQQLVQVAWTTEP